MRQVIYDYIDGLGLRGYTLTSHLPWEDSGEPLYFHNKKYIYVDTAQTEQRPLFDTLDLGGSVEENTTVSVYFVNDAKILPADYDNTVEVIKGARLAPGTEGFIQKLCQVSSSYDKDNVVTKFVFSFKKLLTN